MLIAILCLFLLVNLTLASLISSPESFEKFRPKHDPEKHSFLSRYSGCPCENKSEYIRLFQENLSATQDNPLSCAILYNEWVEFLEKEGGAGLIGRPRLNDILLPIIKANLNENVLSLKPSELLLLQKLVNRNFYFDIPITESLYFWYIVDNKVYLEESSACPQSDVRTNLLINALKVANSKADNFYSKLVRRLRKEYVCELELYKIKLLREVNQRLINNSQPKVELL